MKRTSLFLKTGQIKQLKAISKRIGVPVAELIRRGIEEIINRYKVEKREGVNHGEEPKE